MSEQCQQPQAHPERCGCAPAGTEQVSSAWLAQLRAEYRQFGDEVERLRGVMAAKDAEIAQLRQHKNDYMEAAEQTARALRNEINDHQEEIRRLDARVSQLAAQQAAVPDVLERARRHLSNAIEDVESERAMPALASLRETSYYLALLAAPAAPQHICLSNKANYETQTDLNAANEIQTAPAAPQQGVVIQDDRASLVNALEQVRTMVGNDEYADDVIGFINRTIYNHARLNADRSVQTDAARDVLAERRRQVEAEGWTPEHDDEHNGGQLARGAAAYAAQAGGVDGDVLFPWSENWWKPCEPRRMLVKAGALILAEIERLDRSAQGGE
ncbi:hypothetical protein LMK08_16755 [Metapseudomonas furukawaii]|uniref:hypothetical protein n=1 Tax=Metapseudomonas furukawaii TaxID=1149133 RepID=UPI00227AC59F|nr:hypothetical protein [Pseudomonas furukawaii]WAG77026.1 hypothetical protein LMK08_16755 [Pseudomonas furukawaii]